MSLWRGLCHEMGWVLFCFVSEVEKGLWVTWFARLSSRPLWWMTGLSPIELKSPATWEAYSKGIGPRAQLLPFEAFKLSLCDKLEQCWRRWIACRWTNLMQLATWGSAMSMCMPFRCHRTLVVLIVGGWPFVSDNREKEISLGMCENGKWGDAICGFDVQRGQVVHPALRLVCRAAMDLKIKKW